MKRLLYLTGFVLLLLPSPACAHALGAEWHIQGDKVLLEAYFSDNTPAQAAVVRVFREPERDRPFLEAKTDAKGSCFFPRPAAGKYRVVVDAGAGHRKELAMEIVVTPAQVPGIALALGSAGFSGLSNLSLGSILALDWAEDVQQDSPGPNREEFTRQWPRVLLGFAGIGALAMLVIWLLRKGS